MPTHTSAAFFKWIKEAPSWGLFVLYGEDRYFVSQALARLTAQLDPEGDTGFNRAAFQGEELKLPALLDALERLPIMAETFCITLTELEPESLSKDDWATLQTALKDLPDTTAVVITLSDKTSFKKGSRGEKLVALADKVGAVGHFPYLSEGVRKSELSRRATRLGGILPPESAELLVSRCPPDYGSLVLELDKLLAFAQGRPITEADVLACTVPTPEATAFELSDALLRGNGREAYRLLDVLFAGKQSGVAIVAALALGFLDHYRAAVALREGKKASAVVKDFSYPANRAWAVDKAFRLAAKYPPRVFGQMITEVYRADRRLKSSRLPERLILEEMTARLLAIPR